MSGNDKMKSPRRKWKVRAALALLVLVVGAVAGGFVFRALPGDQFAELDEVDRTMFTQLSKQHEIFRANASQILL